MLLRNTNTVRSGLRPMYPPYCGIRGDLVPADGDSGPSIMYPQLELPADAAYEWAYWVEDAGDMPAGFWPLADDGTGTRGPFADGAYSSPAVALYRNDVRLFDFPVALLVGPQLPTVSRVRTYTIYPAPALPNPVTDETLLLPTYAHDVDSLLEYTWDWAPWLADVSDTVQALVLEHDAGVTEVQQQLAGAQITTWVELAGLAVGALPRMKCHITTVGGRVDDRSIQLQVVQR